jgi:hypothetical protein
MLLWRAMIAAPKSIANGKDRDFYVGQIKVAQFFIHSILPITHGRLVAVSCADSATIEMPDPAFGA